MNNLKQNLLKNFYIVPIFVSFILLLVGSFGVYSAFYSLNRTRMLSHMTITPTQSYYELILKIYDLNQRVTRLYEKDRETSSIKADVDQIRAMANEIKQSIASIEDLSNSAKYQWHFQRLTNTWREFEKNLNVLTVTDTGISKIISENLLEEVLEVLATNKIIKSIVENNLESRLKKMEEQLKFNAIFCISFMILGLIFLGFFARKIYLVMFDILIEDEETRAALEEHRRQVNVQSNLSALGEVAGGIAHEINNPLTTIKMASRAIKRTLDKNPENTQKVAERLELIDETVNRIGNIINTMKGLLRDNYSKKEFRPLMMKTTLQEVHDLFREKLSGYGISYSLTCDLSEEETTIFCHKTQLTQIFVNLFQNSIDAIESLPEKWIKTSIENTEGWIVFKFTDSGKGIPEDIQRKIFEPFFTTKEIGKGTGMGLSLVHKIIQSHEGKFYLDNDSPNTCFIIKLRPNNQSGDEIKKSA